MSRVCKAVSETINASDMGNIFNNITLTLNEDLDPDINMFDTLTRSPSKYFSEDEFTDLVDSSLLQSNFKIAHLNIRSYGKNQSYLLTYMENLKANSMSLYLLKLGPPLSLKILLIIRVIKLMLSHE